MKYVHGFIVAGIASIGTEILYALMGVNTPPVSHKLIILLVMGVALANTMFRTK